MAFLPSIDTTNKVNSGPANIGLNSLTKFFQSNLIKASASRGFDKLGQLGKKKLYYIRNPDRRYQPFFWRRCRGSNSYPGEVIRASLVFKILVLVLLLVCFQSLFENPKKLVNILILVFSLFKKIQKHRYHG